MTKTLEQFKNETMGGSYGNPGTNTYVGQCVSYVRRYMEEVLGVPSRINGNAVDYYNSAFMAQSFNKVPQGQEQNGDILCWGNDAGGMTGPEGHIAIRYSPGKMLNQNYGGSLRVSINTFFSAGYQGALRLKGDNNMADKVNLDTARIITHGVLARNGLAGRQSSLSGSQDGDLTTNHVGRDLTNAYIQGLFLSDEGKGWRDVTTSQSIPGINNALNSIPAKDAEISKLNTTVVARDKEIVELKKQLASCGGIDQETKDKITETNSTVKFVKDLLTRVFK